ncbi:unnamed protein product [Albugo candida]|uniref:Peptidase S26 domain-containing protein n=1 Tax=Albugo candida TaxID=65357 RepID=A0A024GRS0_9STRA|nr:unnamed protein product [Albugo candida]|eukprot:CCI49615.1 unnamed protein product [Albugo candida]
MLPTLNRNGDIVLLDKVTPSIRPIRKGEVVVSKSVSDPRNTICKRVIAEEGDMVCVRPTYAGSTAEFHRIPRGYVWLEGDNKHDSHDSRNYGPIPRAMIIGRVRMRIWPLHQVHRIE